MRIDEEQNPQVSGAFQRSQQVTESARLNLSRWRHGFEPRWDYESKAPGQGSSRESIRSLNATQTLDIPQISRTGSRVRERAHASRVDALAYRCGLHCGIWLGGCCVLAGPCVAVTPATLSM